MDVKIEGSVTELITSCNPIYNISLSTFKILIEMLACTVSQRVSIWSIDTISFWIFRFCRYAINTILDVCIITLYDPAASVMLFMRIEYQCTNRLAPAALQWPTDLSAACCHCSLLSG